MRQPVRTVSLLLIALPLAAMAGQHDVHSPVARAAALRPLPQGHRVECAMCVNVALESTRMLETGRSVREMREAMDAKHSRYLKWSTATPPVR